MNFARPAFLKVYFLRNNEKLLMGRLGFKNGEHLFEYDAAFLHTGLELSPFKLPLKPGVIVSKEPIFEGLFGVFNDSLPDGWGRLLLDRKLQQLGLILTEITPLDRLRFVGRHGLGALLYEPVWPEMQSSDKPQLLDILAEESLQIQEKYTSDLIDTLWLMNGSSAGAQPKALVTIENHQFFATDNTRVPTGNDWIIKFPASRESQEVGLIEYAYHLMAKRCSLEVPHAELFPSKHIPGYFGVKRFDRTPPSVTHMHSASGLLHADHRVPSLDYDTLMKATLLLTRSVKECEKMLRLAAFNLLSHNRDDHAKNFSFLMSADGSWRLSPAYDLNYSIGPGGEHCTSFQGEGRNPKMKHLIHLGELCNTSMGKSKELIAAVQEGVNQWGSIAKEVGLSSQQTQLIQKAIEKVARQFRS